MSSREVRSGKLFVVPTPVGNLEDITLRALRVLRECDLVLAEDTRTSGVLLKHFGIEKRRQSYHKFNEHRAVMGLVSLLKQGQQIALISDAGTPAISDPGFLLVRACVENNVPVECLPGATAFVPALVESGLPADRFCFEGFLPQKKGRTSRLKQLSDETRTLIFYESPYRVTKTLSQLAEHLGEERPASVSREISKMFAETVRGTLHELTEHFTLIEPKGEFVIVVAGATTKEVNPVRTNLRDESFK